MFNLMHGSSLWDFSISIVKKFPNKTNTKSKERWAIRKRCNQMFTFEVFLAYTLKNNDVGVVHFVHYLLNSENTTMLSPGCCSLPEVTLPVIR